MMSYVTESATNEFGSNSTFTKTDFGWYALITMSFASIRTDPVSPDVGKAIGVTGASRQPVLNLMRVEERKQIGNLRAVVRCPDDIRAKDTRRVVQAGVEVRREFLD